MLLPPIRIDDKRTEKKKRSPWNRHQPRCNRPTRARRGKPQGLFPLDQRPMESMGNALLSKAIGRKLRLKGLDHPIERRGAGKNYAHAAYTWNQLIGNLWISSFHLAKKRGKRLLTSKTNGSGKVVD